MEILKNRSKISAITFVLMLTIVAMLGTCLPAVNAYNPNIPTYGFIVVSPNPVGVGQSVWIVTWIDQMPPFKDPSLGSWSAAWADITLEITEPNGNKQTLGPFDTDPIGNTYRMFTPDQIGTYYFQMFFPGEDYPVGWDYSGSDLSGYYEPCSSKKLALTVQQEQIEYLPEIPLPTDFWERPIYGENYQWGSIGGNWLGNLAWDFGLYNVSGNFNPYTTAPNTAHIVWTKPIEFGGIVGEPYGEEAYYGGISYEGRPMPPVIIGGRLYYNLPLAHSQSGGGVACVDLRTGELLWQKPISISQGQLFHYESPNQQGVHAYLWHFGFDGCYRVYDAFSGELAMTYTNTMYPSKVMNGPHGEILVYILDHAHNWLAMWNSSRPFPDLYAGETGTNAWQWRIVGKTVDWSKGIQWNVTIRDMSEVPLVTGRAFTGRTHNSDILTVVTSQLQNVPEPIIMVFGYSAKTGEELWQTNITTTTVRVPAANFSPLRDGVFTYFKQEEKRTYGYDGYTGQLIWGPTDAYENDWSMYYESYAGGGPQSPNVAYGKLYAVSYDGMVHAHDLKNGEIVWEYSTGNAGLETPYGTWPTYGSPTIADGKLYVPTTEHSINNPIWRGEKLHCVNATTGEGIWNISAVMPGSVVADGYLVGLNSYDSQIYCFGKGKTATTVTASPKVSEHGKSILIEGTVTDQSPGGEDTPAIADEYMSEWMEYLYMQKPCPKYYEGVEVKLEVFDPNGNFYEIGTVTSDGAGMFKKMWTPEHEGEYTIIATFEGSESYWRSFAETAVGVGPAEAPSGPIEPEPTEPAEAPLITTETAIIVAAVIVAVAVIVGFWIIRKRK